MKTAIAEKVFTWTKFCDFCTILRESHQSQFFLATYKKQHFLVKIDYFWLKMDVIRSLNAKIAKNVLNVAKFGDFCSHLHYSLQSQFFLATYKNLHFLAKIDQFRLGMDVTRWLKTAIAKKSVHFDEIGDFRTNLHESHQSQCFLATYKKQHFW